MQNGLSPIKTYHSRTKAFGNRTLQAQIRRERRTTLNEIAAEHRDLLIEYLNNFPQTRTLPAKLLKRHTSTVTILRWIVAQLLIDSGYTVQNTAKVMGRNHSSVIPAVTKLQQKILDNPNQPFYTDPHAQKNCAIAKPDLLRIYQKMKDFNQEILAGKVTKHEKNEEQSP